MGSGLDGLRLTDALVSMLSPVSRNWLTWQWRGDNSSRVRKASEYRRYKTWIIKADGFNCSFFLFHVFVQVGNFWLQEVLNKGREGPGVYLSETCSYLCSLHLPSFLSSLIMGPRMPLGSAGVFSSVPQDVLVEDQLSIGCIQEAGTGALEVVGQNPCPHGAVHSRMLTRSLFPTER